MRTIKPKFKVECGKKYCLDCMRCSFNACQIFDVILRENKFSWSMRCQACLDAEEK